MTGNVPKYWTTDQVDEKLDQYRKELASLKEEKAELIDGYRKIKIICDQDNDD